MAAAPPAAAPARPPPDDEFMRSFGVGRLFQDRLAEAVNSAAFHATTDLLYTAGNDDAVVVYNIETGKRSAVIPSARYGCAHITATHAETAVAFASGHPDAQSAGGVAATDPASHHAVRYLSLPDAAFIRFFKGHTAAVTSLALHPSNDMLLSAARDDTVRMWDLRSPVGTGVMSVPGTPAVACDRQGLIFAVGVAGGVIKLFDARNYSAGPFCTYAVVSSVVPPGAGGGGAPGQAPPAPGAPPPAAPPSRPAPQGFSDLSFSPSGILLAAVAGPDVWSLDAYEGYTRTHIHTGGTAVGGGGAGGAAAPAAPPATTTAPPPPPESRASWAGPPGGQATFSPDDNYILAGCANGAVGVWGSGATQDTAGRSGAVWTGGGGGPAVLRWAPRRQCVVAAGGGALALWVPRQRQGGPGGAAGA